MLSSVLLLLAGCRDYDADGKANVEATRVVVKAIEAYRADHQAAPPDLNALVPHYMRALPELKGSAHWEYRLYGKEFEVRFNGPAPTWVGGYSSERKLFYHDSK